MIPSPASGMGRKGKKTKKNKIKGMRGEERRNGIGDERERGESGDLFGGRGTWESVGCGSGFEASEGSHVRDETCSREQAPGEEWVGP